jgi:hypothetical protein
MYSMGRALYTQPVLFFVTTDLTFSHNLAETKPAGKNDSSLPANCEGARIIWPTMLVVGSANSSPGPTIVAYVHSILQLHLEQVCSQDTATDATTNPANDTS